MKILSWLVSLVGLAVLALSVYGRFHDEPTMTLFGTTYACGKILLAGDSILLVGILLGLVDLQTRK